MSRYPKIIGVTASGGSSFSPSEHSVQVYGEITDGLASVQGRRVRMALTADQIRSQVLTWVAQHPDEFGPAVRAIAAAWNEIGEDRLDHSVHAYDSRRDWYSTVHAAAMTRPVPLPDPDDDRKTFTEDDQGNWTEV